MMEWSPASKYNSFNSLKGLLYFENYKKIMAWMRRETNYLPPPVECNLDPIAECNAQCYFCITQRYLRNNREEVGSMRMLPEIYMYELVDFLSTWGVKGLCISGGGEPSLNRNVHGLPLYAALKGMDVAFVTNGIKMDDELMESLLACRWVSFSINAATEETHKQILGVSMFRRVIANVSRIADLRKKQGSQVDLCYKFLLLPENVSEMVAACKLAKKIGVQDFHVRPVDFERSDIKGNRKLEFDIPFIEEQFALCHEEETPDFKVYTVVHKFDAAYHVQHDFRRCLASPLVLPILSDGNAYLCVDRKMEETFRLGSAYPNPEKIYDWWGSEKHRALIESVDISTCSRCTWSEYQKQISDCVIEDKLCRNFP